MFRLCSEEADQFGHRKLGGIGDRVADALKRLSPKFNQGRRVNAISQRLGYLVRSGDSDALDSIVPMAFGNLALDLIDVDTYYDLERLRPKYKAFAGMPLFIMTSDA